MSTAAARYATYPGDTTHIIGEVKGPNTWGEHLTAVTAEYNPDSNTTRVGFNYTTTNDINETSK